LRGGGGRKRKGRRGGKPQKGEEITALQTFYLSFLLPVRSRKRREEGGEEGKKSFQEGGEEKWECRPHGQTFFAHQCYGARPCGEGKKEKEEKRGGEGGRPFIGKKGGKRGRRKVTVGCHVYRYISHVARLKLGQPEGEEEKKKERGEKRGITSKKERRGGEKKVPTPSRLTLIIFLPPCFTGWERLAVGKKAKKEKKEGRKTCHFKGREGERIGEIAGRTGLPYLALMGREKRERKEKKEETGQGKGVW